MTTTTPASQPRGDGPAGMPSHLWELAKSDVRLAVPDRVREAAANGADAPAGVRRVAARVAATGAALGVPAAIASVGGVAAGTTEVPVAPADVQTPLDPGPPDGGLDPAPAVPGSHPYGDTGAPGAAEGGASSFTTGTGDVGSGLGTTWRVQEGGAEDGGDWLTIEMFQDVTVHETADGMFVVDAYQFIVIRDDDGNEYVFKEHYQVVVPDPPGEETDLVVHERGHVHVIENPDGSFTVATADYGIEVTSGADGDGRDEVGITQTQGVRITDRERHPDDDIELDLTSRAVSTSDDTGDEATGTIGQSQVVTDRELPPPPPWADGPGPFGEQPADRGAAPTAQPASGPASGNASGAGTTASAAPGVPLASTLGAPVAGAAWEVGGPEPDRRVADRGDRPDADDGVGDRADGAPEPDGATSTPFSGVTGPATTPAPTPAPTPGTSAATDPADAGGPEPPAGTGATGVGGAASEGDDGPPGPGEPDPGAGSAASPSERPLLETDGTADADGAGADLDVAAADSALTT